MFNVGDKVILRDDLELHKTYGGGFTWQFDEDIAKVKGYVGTVTVADNRDGSMNLSMKCNPYSDTFWWVSDMFELYEEATKSIFTPTRLTEDYKFKVGDRVVVKEDLEQGRLEVNSVHENMLVYRGETLVIESLTFSDTNQFKVTTNDWTWNYHMLSDVNPPPKTNVKEEEEKTVFDYEVGDTVVIRDDLDVGVYYGSMKFCEPMAPIRGQRVELVRHDTNDDTFKWEDSPSNYWLSREMIVGIVADEDLDLDDMTVENIGKYPVYNDTWNGLTEFEQMQVMVYLDWEECGLYSAIDTFMNDRIETVDEQDMDELIEERFISKYNVHETEDIFDYVDRQQFFNDYMEYDYYFNHTYNVYLYIG